MSAAGTTSWDLIAAAGRGDVKSQSAFAVRYEPLIRRVLAARWRGSWLLPELDDAVQDVLLECIRGEGALQRADREYGRGFRTFLAGIVHNVAARAETRAAKDRQRFQEWSGNDVAVRERSTTRQLDVAWMEMIVHGAGERFRAECAADTEGGAVLWEVLRLRFQCDLPVRDIAARLGRPAASVHVDYRRARRRFRLCIDAELAEHADSSLDVARLWRELRDTLRSTP